MPKYKVGDKSGNLEILGFLEIRNKNYNRTRTQAICQCHKCHRTDYHILPYNFRKQKSCGCDRVWNSPPSGESSKFYKGYKGISSKYIENARHRAQYKKLPFDLTLEFLWKLYEEQGGKCAISGTPISFGNNSRSTGASASLDRIDPHKGYTKVNVQWVHVEINYMKHKFSTNKFFDWCVKVCLHNNLLQVI